MKKKIKIYSYAWHMGHQHELCKIPNTLFHYQENYLKSWVEESRPFPKNAKMVSCFKPNYYDLAILHIDQQCILPDIHKGKLYRETKRTIQEQQPGLPIIIVNHGTPCYPERFTLEEAVEQIRPLLQGVNIMVVNSEQAGREWNNIGRIKVIPIIHGLSTEEWIKYGNVKKELRVATFISPDGIGNKYYGRLLFNETRRILRRQYSIELQWIGISMPSFKNWTEYKKYLGKSLIYFNPTFGSPMPRARAEAMMMGCCVVTTQHHDISKYIEDGVNGYICLDNPNHAAQIINKCIENYKQTVKIGKRGQATAIKHFNINRYTKEWKKIIESVL